MRTRHANIIEIHGRETAESYGDFLKLESRPFVLRDLISDWPALELWQQQDHWVKRLGVERLQVERYEDSHYMWDGRKLVTLATREFLEEIWQVDRPKHFLADVSILKGKRFGKAEYPLLTKDIALPALVSQGRLRSVGLFLGGHSTTQCHFHPVSEALLCQVIGRKTLYLFPPEATPALKPYPWYGPNMNWSTLEFSYDGLPSALRSIPYSVHEIHLNPGDALFIPMNWWHSAHGHGISASATFFWNSRLGPVLKNPLLPRTLRYLVKDPSWLYS